MVEGAVRGGAMRILTMLDERVKKSPRRDHIGLANMVAPVQAAIAQLSAAL